MMATGGAFLHDAFVYRSADEFLAGALPFIREGLALDEPILAAPTMSGPPLRKPAAVVAPTAPAPGPKRRPTRGPARPAPAARVAVARLAEPSGVAAAAASLPVRTAARSRHPPPSPSCSPSYAAGACDLVGEPGRRRGGG